ncbi:MAG: inositol monophosphatase family protein [Planctomycetota bacterium]
MTDDLKRLLQTATTAARLGGEVLLHHASNGVTIRDKTDSGEATYNLVSDADLESEQVIAEFLRTRYPEHHILGEEELASTDPSAPHLWIIDPLDGTNNYAHGLQQYAVSIAYYHQGEPIVGAIYCPPHDEMFRAVTGRGAFRGQMRVRVSKYNSLDKCLIGCGFYYDRGEMMRSTLGAIEDFFQSDIHGIRRFGTASLDLCMVGCGQFGGFFEYQLAPWDYAAGRLFIEEAGGRVTTTQGGPLPIAKTSIVASNGEIHEAMLAITRRHQPHGLAKP